MFVIYIHFNLSLIHKKQMSYYNRIKDLTKHVPTTLVDFNVPRDIARTPTQASSNFKLWQH
jgi:AccI restriction endonuclease